MQVAIVGGSAAGLTAALMLAREGHTVDVVDGDPLDPAADPEEAARSVVRPGAPHLAQVHQLMPLARNLLSEHLPDVYAGLLRAGGVESPVTDRMPPSLADRSRHTDDELLVALQIRRSTFDWVLRMAASRQRRIQLRGGERATGLVVRPGRPPRVTGVRTERGTVPADVVVDAAGRRSPVDRWLSEGGARRARVGSDCGISYYTRHYRLRRSAPAPEPGRLFAITPLPYVTLAAATADNDVLLAGLAPLTEDRPLRALRHAAVLDAALQTIPRMREWLAAAEPLTEVRAMGGMRNALVRSVIHQRPTVLGIHSIGDALCTTNPTLGRGISVAIRSALDLVEVLGEYAEDATGQALRMDEAVTAHVEPWFSEQLRVDTERVASVRRSLGRPVAAPAPKGSRPTPGELRLAAAVDPVVFRALLAVIAMLKTPQEVYDEPAIRSRICEALTSLPRLPRQEPSREALLRAVNSAGS